MLGDVYELIGAFATVSHYFYGNFLPNFVINVSKKNGLKALFWQRNTVDLDSW